MSAKFALCVLVVLGVAALADAQAQVSGFWIKKDEDLKGNDLAANGQGFYKVCGDEKYVASKCLEPHKGGNCEAFVWSPAEKCGYLKYKSGPTTPRGGFYVYVKGAPPPTPSPPYVQGYMTMIDADIAGNNLAANGNGYYKVCGDPGYVATKCNEPHKGGVCKAFTYSPTERCGYLKYADGPTSTRIGWYVYKRTGSPSPAPSTGCQKYNSNGDVCDLAQGICCGGNKVSCTNGRCISSYPTSGRKMQ